MDKDDKTKVLSQWKRCADLAITCNSGETVRQYIFSDANYNHWRVSNEITVGQCIFNYANYNHWRVSDEITVGQCIINYANNNHWRFSNEMTGKGVLGEAWRGILL